MSILVGEVSRFLKMRPPTFGKYVVVLLVSLKFGIVSAGNMPSNPNISMDSIEICPSRHQCLSRCGMKPPEWYECGCDPACEYYGDCCYDYWSTCERSHVTPPTTVDADQLQCLKGEADVAPEVLAYGYYAVALCGEDSVVDIATIEKCEHPGTDDVLLSIIVSDGDDNVYKNVYCALCNGVLITDVTAWRAWFQCMSIGQPTTARFGTSSPKVHEQIGDNCPQVYFEPPPGKMDTRRACYSDVISSCDEIYGDDAVIRACETKYKALVKKNWLDKVYMNPHCAICNYHTNYICSFSFIGYSSDFTPLSIIVDFNARSSITVDWKDGSYSTEGIACAAGEVFDPFTSKCLQLACKAGFTLRDYKCVPPSASPGCGTSAVSIQEDIFCLCKLQEHSMYIEYHYTGDNLTSVDGLTKDINVLGVEYSEKLFVYQNTTIVALSIDRMNCQLAYAIYNLVISGFNNNGSDEQRNVVMFKQNCSLIATPNALFCDHFGFSISEEFSAENIRNTTLVPEDGYILEVVYKFENESYICGGLSVSTCEACPRIEVDASAFLDPGNGTLVHQLTGEVFEGNEYLLSNVSNASSSFIVCSFLDQTTTIRRTQFFTYSGVLLFISVVGTFLSLICLIITVVLRAIFAELRTLSGKIIINISISLFCALLLTLIQGNFTAWKTLCTIVATVLHYLWLVSFLWMNTLAFELFRTFRVFRASPRSKRSQNRSLICYFVYSWGIPAVYVGIITGLTMCECTGLNVLYGDDSVCWIRDELASFYVFGIPLAVVLTPNLILFVATITGIREARQSTAVVSGNKSKRKQLTEEMVIYIRISTAMGLSWAIGFVASFVDHVILWYLFTVLNSLQGSFIFVAFNINHSTNNLMKSRGKKKAAATTQKKTKDTSLSTVSRQVDGQHASQ